MITTIVIFILVLGVLVFVHEFGHFVMARKMGMKVEEFGFGFPPRIWGKKGKDGVLYSVNWIPIGGFVKIKGENFDEEVIDDPDSFSSKRPWKRFIVLIAGVVMNFLLCAVLIAGGYLIGLPQTISENIDAANIRDHKVQVVSIIKDSPAAEAGLEIGDVIAGINGEDVESTETLISSTKEPGAQDLAFLIYRGEETLTPTITPVLLEETGEKGIGIGVVETAIVSYPWYLAIYKGFETTVLLTGAIVVAFYNIIANLLVGASPGVVVAGPVGIAVMTGQVAELGFVYILQFTAILSLNLAILNFLPFPALDGGRIIFVILEMFRRKPINYKVESIIHAAGFLILLLLIVLVTFGDIVRYSDFFGGLWNGLIH